MALKYNFFAELAAQFPYPPEAGNPLQKQVETLQKEKEDLQKELAIYKSIVLNRQQP